ncbi:hypothetical protein CEUSTIGMA_g9553.t1 [Chlamydomonas eustigma]|uniref:RING-type domain-containing protein n=1 Tax=Chlamydomonas eustigma TaxID=1157962 RepID=A0A250XGC0_9CHLO|nr:hypothetical protein CEUSTIGMA_g9553.t1 [Chlamydomonas eustigma]|eukprot:GAX82125.1 hypothetical protein CEUSTIGMA_g9553.t1 [Chlamydomonas eustigma]
MVRKKQSEPKKLGTNLDVEGAVGEPQSQPGVSNAKTISPKKGGKKQAKRTASITPSSPRAYLHNICNCPGSQLLVFFETVCEGLQTMKAVSTAKEGAADIIGHYVDGHEQSDEQAGQSTSAARQHMSLLNEVRNEVQISICCNIQAALHPDQDESGEILAAGASHNSSIPEEVQEGQGRNAEYYEGDGSDELSVAFSLSVLTAGGGTGNDSLENRYVQQVLTLPVAPNQDSASALLSLLSSGRLGVSIRPATSNQNNLIHDCGPSNQPIAVMDNAGPLNHYGCWSQSKHDQFPLMPNKASSSSHQQPSWVLQIGFLKSALGSHLMPLARNAEDDARRLWQYQLLEVLNWLCPSFRKSCNEEDEEDVEDSFLKDDKAAFDLGHLYRLIRPTGAEPEAIIGSDQGLVPTLRPYQKRAVAWMLQREQASATFKISSRNTSNNPDDELVTLHPLWRRLLLRSWPHHHPGLDESAIIAPDNDDNNAQRGAYYSSQQALYINPYTGLVSKPQAFLFNLAGDEAEWNQVKGGILSDEMGLGKTVELLACILGHRFGSSAQDDESLPSNILRLSEVKSANMTSMADNTASRQLCKAVEASSPPCYASRLHVEDNLPLRDAGGQGVDQQGDGDVDFSMLQGPPRQQWSIPDDPYLPAVSVVMNAAAGSKALGSHELSIATTGKRRVAAEKSSRKQAHTQLPSGTQHQENHSSRDRHAAPAAGHHDNNDDVEDEHSSGDGALKKSVQTAAARHRNGNGGESALNDALQDTNDCHEASDVDANEQVAAAEDDDSDWDPAKGSHSAGRDRKHKRVRRRQGGGKQKQTKIDISMSSRTAIKKQMRRRGSNNAPCHADAGVLLIEPACQLASDVHPSPVGPSSGVKLESVGVSWNQVGMKSLESASLSIAGLAGHASHVGLPSLHLMINGSPGSLFVPTTADDQDHQTNDELCPQQEGFLPVVTNDDECLQACPLLALDHYPQTGPAGSGFEDVVALTGVTAPVAAASGRAAVQNGQYSKQDGRASRERVECYCGVFSADPTAGGSCCGRSWLLCGECLAWMHLECVGAVSRAMMRRVKRSSGDQSFSVFTCMKCLKHKASQQIHTPCGATLIVCPSAILDQWSSEINRHTLPGALRVKIYLGQHQNGEVVTAAELAASDVVLTTYDVLRADVSRQPDLDEHGRSLRRSKKYEVLPTPLTRLKWWRVVLDEAQMVESGTAAAAKMALKLSTVHRWCVTGTPISTGLDDLYGLMVFLRTTPWDQKAWWSRVMAGPANTGLEGGMRNLVQLLRPSSKVPGGSRGSCGGDSGGLMWRTAKSDVSQELNIPPQRSATTVLRFSAVERHFYRRQHKACITDVKAAIPADVLKLAMSLSKQAATSDINVDAKPVASKSTAALPSSHDDELDARPSNTFTATNITADDKTDSAHDLNKGTLVEVIAVDDDSSVVEPSYYNVGTASSLVEVVGRELTEKEQKKLLPSLLKLRQACCHPQAGSGGLKALTNQGAPMSMDEILGVLIAKAKVEAEEAQRALVGSLNGLAGVMLLEGQVEEAVKTYREAVRVIEENKQSVRTDPLQRLHTLHNLNELLTSPDLPPAIPKTLRDHALLEEANAIRNKYLGLSAARLVTTKAEVCDTLRESGLVAPDEVLDAAIIEATTATTAAMTTIKTSSASKAASKQTAVLAAYATTAGGSIRSTDLLDGHKAVGSMSSWIHHAVKALIVNGSASDVADAVRSKLLEKDDYRRAIERNASSLGLRFRDLSGLRYLLSQEVADQEAAGMAVAKKIMALGEKCETPTPQMIETAATCGRCRSELGIPGRLCEHCGLDELMVQWEVRLFYLDAVGGTVGDTVTAEEAAKRANANMLRRVGRGGLGEQQVDLRSAVEGSLSNARGDGGGRLEGDGTVLETRTLWMPSEAEQALGILLTHFEKIMCGGASGASEPDCPGDGIAAAAGSKQTQVADSQYTKVLEGGRAHLAQLKAQRKLLVQMRSLGLAQRMHLYAHDELKMATMGFQLVPDTQAVIQGHHHHHHHERASQHSQALRYQQLLLHREQLPAKNIDLGLEKVVAQSDLTKALGTLRYLSALSKARARPSKRAAEPQSGGTNASSAQGSEQKVQDMNAVTGDMESKNQLILPLSNPEMATKAEEDSTAAQCPICHDAIGCQCVMLPCGHQVCCECYASLLERLPGAAGGAAGLLALHRHIDANRTLSCPTCRARTLVSDIAYIDTGASLEGGSRASRKGAWGTSSLAPPPLAVTSSDIHDVEAEVAWEASPWVTIEAEQTVRGSYGTKLEAVLRRIKAVLQGDPSSKIIVFSTWLDVMDILSHALRANQISHAFPKNGGNFRAALSRFRSCPEVKQSNHDSGPGATFKTSCAIEAGDSSLQAQGLPGGLIEDMGDAPDSIRIATEEEEGGVHSLSNRGPSIVGGMSLSPTAALLKRRSKRSRGVFARRPACKIAHDNPRVLMLLLKQGGAGLTLTEAQHVVLIEPILDPASEQQSLGRVHRIGQTRETWVHRFIIENTVEEKVQTISNLRRAALSSSQGVTHGFPCRNAGAITLMDVTTLLQSSTDGDDCVDSQAVSDDNMSSKDAVGDSGDDRHEMLSADFQDADELEDVLMGPEYKEEDQENEACSDDEENEEEEEKDDEEEENDDDDDYDDGGQEAVLWLASPGQRKNYDQR